MMHIISTHVDVVPIGSPGLYVAVRAGFVNQGSSLNKWCLAHGVSRQTAERALSGVTTTRKALRLVASIIAEALLGAHADA